MKTEINATTLSRAQLSILMEAYQLASWQWNRVTDRFDIDAVWLSKHNLDVDLAAASRRVWNGAMMQGDRERVAAVLESALGEGKSYRVEYRLKTLDEGRWFWVEECGGISGEESPEAVCGTLRDINAFKEQELLIRSQEHYFQTLLEKVPGVPIQGYDVDRRVVYWNDASSRLYGYSREEAMGQTIESLIIPEPMRANIVKKFRRWLEENRACVSGESIYVTKKGDRVPIFTSHIILHQGAPHSELYCINIDLRYQKHREEEIRKLANYDPLTGLPNRLLFFEYAQHELRRATREERKLAVMFIDLDNFKMVNDTFGHEEGDRFLKQITTNIRACVREADMLARFGGDEFVLFCSYTQEYDLIYLLQRLMEATSRNVGIDHTAIRVGASVGVALFPKNGNNLNTLLKYADIAMYHAKSNGKNRFHFFTDSLNETLQLRMSIESGVQRALDNNEFSLVFQPIVVPETGEMAGCEVLVRWQQEGAHFIKPEDFIPVIEESGQIAQVGEWILDEAVTQMAEFNRVVGEARPFFSLNLSPKRFYQRDLDRQILQKLEQYGVAPGQLELEITERVLMHSEEEVVKVLDRLRNRGVHICIDDFGTGYSSLSYLTRFPVDVIKIDRSFVSQIHDVRSQKIAQAIVAMCRGLQIKCVAEGIEAGEQLDDLCQKGCDLAQGYYFCKPVPLEELIRYFQAHHA